MENLVISTELAYGLRQDMICSLCLFIPPVEIKALFWKTGRSGGERTLSWALAMSILRCRPAESRCENRMPVLYHNVDIRGLAASPHLNVYVRKNIISRVKVKPYF